MGEDNSIVHWRLNLAAHRYQHARLKKVISVHRRDYMWSQTRLTESDSPAALPLPPSTLLFRFWLFTFFFWIIIIYIIFEKKYYLRFISLLLMISKYTLYLKNKIEK